MLLEFKTKRNTYGHRKYLAIDTENKTYSRFCHKMCVDGIEIKSSDMGSLIKQLESEGYIEKD